MPGAVQAIALWSFAAPTWFCSHQCWALQLKISANVPALRLRRVFANPTSSAAATFGAVRKAGKRREISTKRSRAIALPVTNFAVYALFEPRLRTGVFGVKWKPVVRCASCSEPRWWCMCPRIVACTWGSSPLSRYDVVASQVRNHSSQSLCASRRFDAAQIPQSSFFMLFDLAIDGWSLWWAPEKGHRRVSCDCDSKGRLRNSAYPSASRYRNSAT